MNLFVRIAMVAAGIVLAALPALRAADEAAPPPPPAATQPDTAARPDRSGRRGRWMDPAERLRRLTEVLGLTAEQQTKIKAVFKEEADKGRAIRDDDSLSREDRRARMMALGQEMRTRLREILTPEQQEKFDAMPRRGRGPRGEGPGVAPPPPPPPEKINPPSGSST